MILKLDIGTLEENLCDTFSEENVIKNGHLNFLKTIKAMLFGNSQRRVEADFSLLKMTKIYPGDNTKF